MAMITDDLVMNFKWQWHLQLMIDSYMTFL